MSAVFEPPVLPDPDPDWDTDYKVQAERDGYWPDEIPGPPPWTEVA